MLTKKHFERIDAAFAAEDAANIFPSYLGSPVAQAILGAPMSGIYTTFDPEDSNE